MTKEEGKQIERKQQKLLFRVVRKEVRRRRRRDCNTVACQMWPARAKGGGGSMSGVACGLRWELEGKVGGGEKRMMLHWFFPSLPTPTLPTPPPPSSFPLLFSLPLTLRDGSLIEGSLLSIGLLPPLLVPNPSTGLIVVIPPRHPPAATLPPISLSLISPKCIIRQVVCLPPPFWGLSRRWLTPFLFFFSLRAVCAPSRRVYLFVCVIEASCPPWLNLFPSFLFFFFFLDGDCQKA